MLKFWTCVVVKMYLLCLPGGHSKAAGVEPRCEVVPNQSFTDTTALSIRIQPGPVRSELRHTRSFTVPTPVCALRKPTGKACSPHLLG